jgi:hypothetical protein
MNFVWVRLTRQQRTECRSRLRLLPSPFGGHSASAAGSVAETHGNGMVLVWNARKELPITDLECNSLEREYQK